MRLREGPYLVDARKTQRDAPVIVLPLQFLLLLSGGRSRRVAAAAAAAGVSTPAATALKATTPYPGTLQRFVVGAVVVVVAAAAIMQFNFDLSAK